MCTVLHQFAKLNYNHRFTQVHNCSRKSRPSESYRQNIFTTKLRGRPFDSVGEGGVWQFTSSQNFYFQSFAGDNIFIQLQHRPFILRYSLLESDGCRTQTRIFILRCFDGQDIYFRKKMLAPSPRLFVT